MSTKSSKASNSKSSTCSAKSTKTVNMRERLIAASRQLRNEDEKIKKDLSALKTRIQSVKEQITTDADKINERVETLANQWIAQKYTTESSADSTSTETMTSSNSDATSTSAASKNTTFASMSNTESVKTAVSQKSEGPIEPEKIVAQAMSALEKYAKNSKETEKAQQTERLIAQMKELLPKNKEELSLKPVVITPLLSNGEIAPVPPGMELMATDSFTTAEALRTSQVDSLASTQASASAHSNTNTAIAATSANTIVSPRK